MKLLELQITEPVPGQVLPEMAAQAGPAEAARRYRAIVTTSLRQLRWLENARLNLTVSPQDAHEAIRFWLLPRLADRWDHDAGIFRSDGWEIAFGQTPTPTATIHVHHEILCPMAGSRWIQAALAGLGTSTGSVIGPASNGGHYLTATHLTSPTTSGERVLPPLPVIRTDADWSLALESPLGPALRRAWEEENP